MPFLLFGALQSFEEAPGDAISGAAVAARVLASSQNWQTEKNALEQKIKDGEDVKAVLEAKVADLDSQVDQLTKVKAELDSQLSEVQVSLKAKDAEIAKVRAELATSQTATATLQTQKTALEEEVKRLTTERAEVADQLKNIQAKFKPVQDQLETQTAENKLLQEKYLKMSKAYARRYQNLNLEQKVFKPVQKKTQDMIEQFLEELKGLWKIFDLLAKELKKARVSKEEMKQALLQVSQIKLTFKQLESYLKERAYPELELKPELFDIAPWFVPLQQMLNVYRQKINELEALVKSLRAQLVDQAQGQSAQVQLEQLQQQHKQLQANLENLQAQSQQLVRQLLARDMPWQSLANYFEQTIKQGLAPQGAMIPEFVRALEPLLARPQKQEEMRFTDLDGLVDEFLQSVRNNDKNLSSEKVSDLEVYFTNLKPTSIKTPDAWSDESKGRPLEPRPPSGAKSESARPQPGSPDLGASMSARA